MIISEELFLLLITDKGGKEPWVTAHDQAMAAGIISDLALGNYIALSQDKKPEISIVDQAGTPQHPALAWGLKQLKEKAPIRVDKTLGATWFRARTEIGNVLAEKGAVEVKESSFLFFTSVTHPVVDGESEEQLRARLAQILHGGAQPDIKDALVLTVLKSIDAAHPLLKKDIESAGGKMSRREVNNRIDALEAELSGVTEELNRVFKSLQLAMYTAIFIAGTSGS